MDVDEKILSSVNAEINEGTTQITKLYQQIERLEERSISSENSKKRKELQERIGMCQDGLKDSRTVRKAIIDARLHVLQSKQIQVILWTLK